MSITLATSPDSSRTRHAAPSLFRSSCTAAASNRPERSRHVRSRQDNLLSQASASDRIVSKATSWRTTTASFSDFSSASSAHLTSRSCKRDRRSPSCARLSKTFKLHASSSSSSASAATLAPSTCHSTSDCHPALASSDSALAPFISSSSCSVLDSIVRTKSSIDRTRPSRSAHALSRPANCDFSIIRDDSTSSLTSSDSLVFN